MSPKNQEQTRGKAKKGKEKPPKPKVPWQYSKAKELLTKDIVDGVVDDNMPPREVIRLRPEYAEYKEYFANYLRTLRASIKANKANAALASRAVKHDRRVMIPFASKPYPAWRRSEADISLKADIADNKHKEMKPKELYESREEYHKFYPLGVFRNHIYQEENSKRESSYWLHRNDKKKTKQEKYRGKDNDETPDQDHYNRYFDYNYESYYDGKGQADDESDSDEEDDDDEDDKSGWNSRNNTMAFI